MVLFLILNAILVIALHRDKSIRNPKIFIAYAIPIFLLSLWGFEYSSGRIQFFISDEVSYARDAYAGFPEMGDRFLWQLVNYWVANYDIYMNGLPLKLMNIPMYIGLLYLLHKMFPYNGNVLILLPLLIPYVAFTAIFNLRDVTIWLFSTMSIYLSSKLSWKSALCIIPLTLLYLLRPFAAMSIIVLILLFKVPEIISYLKKAVNPSLAVLRLLVSISLILVLLVMAYPKVASRIQTYNAWFEYTSFEGKKEHIESLPDNTILTGSNTMDFAIAAVRYFFTPMPHSLIGRIAVGGSENWGLVDDFVRLANQICYYCMIFYLLFNMRYIIATIRSFSKTQIILLISLAMYWPIYSYHLYGITHQRLKLPLQISLFLIVLAVHSKKQKFAKSSGMNVGVN